MRIQNKLFIASLAGCALLVGAMFALTQWSVDRGMLDYVNTRETERWQRGADALVDWHAQEGSWERLQREPHRLHRILTTAIEGDGDYRPPRERPQGGRPPGGRPPRPGSDLPAPILLDADGRAIAGRMRNDSDYRRIPLLENGAVIGYLAIGQRDRLDEGFELTFVRQQREALLLLSALVLLLAAITSLPLARNVVTPLRRLAGAAREMADGDYSQRIEIDRGDELGELAADFNQLGEALEASDRARKRWIADTSHELRTPVAVIRGELEAMLDGVREVSIENIRAAHQEVLHLGRLVEDLHELTRAENGGIRYRMESVPFEALVEDACDQHRSLVADSGLTLTLQPLPTHALVFGDETRLNQLLANLLSNSCKYTDPGGRIEISMALVDNEVVLVVEDSAPGVPEEAMPRLFDYLYRVEASRARDTGGSGLGLALCRRIVEAHRGDIEACRSALGGLKVEIRLPGLVEDTA